MTARERFKLGQRVRTTEEWNKVSEALEGVVIGFSKFSHLTHVVTVAVFEKEVIQHNHIDQWEPAE